jgi:hypothetical protein
MPKITVREISLGDAFGKLGVGNSAKKDFGNFPSHPHPAVSSATDYRSQGSTVPPTYLAYYQKQAETYRKVVMGSGLILLAVVVVLAWLLIKKSGEKKTRHNANMFPGGGVRDEPATVSLAPSASYDLKDKEIDCKDREIERKEKEIERKEKDIERERSKRERLSSKLEAERRNFERELGGTKDELKRLREEREKLQKELEAQQSKHAAEMRLTREEYEAKSLAVRKRFEEQLSEFETTQKQFWPEVFREARSLGAFCECVKDSFAEGSNSAASLYAELVNLGSRLDDMQAFVNRVSPVGKALYAWIYDTGRTGDGFDSLLAQWLTEKVSSVDLKVVAVQPGEAYNNSIHDCANLNGNSVAKVLSFLILGKNNRTELKALVEVR